MGDDDIRNYINSQGGAPKAPPVRVVRRKPAPQPPPQRQASYDDFSATQMFCGTCKRAMPVRERLLLFLPDGDLYDYQCTGCGGSTGTKKAGR